jgi:hypothetical protein
MDRKQSAFVMRFNDMQLPLGSTTVGEHNKIFQAKGKVWVGKMGRPVAKSTLSFDPGTCDFHLLLIRSFTTGFRNTRTDIAFISAISHATTDKPPRDYVPEYYRNNIAMISAWFCLNEPLQYIDRKELTMWTVRSSGKLVIDSMTRGTASFFVGDRKPGHIVRSNPPGGALLENDPRPEPPRLLDSDVLEEEEHVMTFDDLRALL